MEVFQNGFKPVEPFENAPFHLLLVLTSENGGF